MGFFSRIKKLWGGDAAPAQPEPSPAPQAPEAEPITTAPTAETRDAAAEIPVPAAPVEPVPTEPAPEESVLAEPAPVEPAPVEPVSAEPESMETAPVEPVSAEPESMETAPVEPVSAEPEPAEPGATEPERIESEPIEPALVEPVLAEPAPEETASVETASAPEAPKTSSWRKFFGLGPKKAELLKAEAEVETETPREPEPPKPELLFQEKPTAKAALEPWQQNLVTALRGAEPKLSIWMGHLLDGVDQRGDVLWTRLRFLFAQLDVPTAESEDFITRFDTWLEDMDYARVEEFRSELQYRMALALDLEDEEDERNRLFLKLSAGLGKTREQLTMRIDQLLSLAGGYDDQFWEELEEILLMADVGMNATQELLKRLKPRVRKAGTRDAAEFKALLKEELIAVFVEARETTVAQPPEVVLMVGVNGAGKTTTIAKLAHRAQMQGRKVLVAAGDTFRAAAIEQLQVWSKRVGAGFYAKAHGSDPAAVAFEAVDYAMKEGYDLVFVDTAGRLQTKQNLMEELKKINRVLGKKLEGAPHRTILVLDATTGQNALSQVKLFSQASPVDEIVLTKLDGTAKGGIIVAIALEFGIPISFVGLGEKMEDLRPFSGPEFASALFD